MYVDLLISFFRQYVYILNDKKKTSNCVYDSKGRFNFNNKKFRKIFHLADFFQ